MGCSLNCIRGVVGAPFTSVFDRRLDFDDEFPFDGLFREVFREFVLVGIFGVLEDIELVGSMEPSVSSTLVVNGGRGNVIGGEQGGVDINDENEFLGGDFCCGVGGAEGKDKIKDGEGEIGSKLEGIIEIKSMLLILNILSSKDDRGKREENGVFWGEGAGDGEQGDGEEQRVEESETSWSDEE
jgi:hypothetical protein